MTHYLQHDYFAGIAGIRKDEEATPESLRSAAKVLEEKANELDKPKVTPRQQKFMDNKYSLDGVWLNQDNTRGYWLISGQHNKKMISSSHDFGWRTNPVRVARSTIYIDGEFLPVVIVEGQTRIDFMKL